MKHHETDSWEEEMRRERRGLQWGMIVWLLVVVGCLVVAWLTKAKGH